MSQIQFMHTESYPRTISALSSGQSKKNTVAKIINEALRVEGYCSHIASPQPATLVFGQPVEELEDRLEHFLSEQRQPVVKNGKPQLRTVRQDAHVLLGTIYSYPVEKDDVDEDKMDQFFQDCLRFHMKEFGDVDSALLHMDETYYHIHVYTLSANAKQLHPGHAANHQRKKDKSLTLTYRKAMSAMQDRFYENVAIEHGMARFGPKRQRMERTAYMKLKSDKEKERLYNLELEEKKKAKEKELDEKVSEAERHYFSSVETLEDEMRYIKDEIDFASSQLGDRKQLQEEIYELRYELARKDALLAEYERDGVRPS